MIVARLSAGLGNQLFQYAFGRHLAIKNNTELWIDTRWYETVNPGGKRRFELWRFNTCWQRHLDGNRLDDAGIPDLQLIKESEHGHSHERWKRIAEMGDNLFLHGLWAFFRDHLFESGFRRLMRREVTLREELDDDVFRAHDARIARSNNSVAVHLRRGDYREHEDMFVLLDEGYYRRAFDVIERKVPTPEYFVFGDEIEWAERHFRFSRDVRFVKTGSQIADFELMRRCRHNITANSTYSWWAAYLNENDDKTVIVPAKYLNNEFLNSLYEISTPTFPVFDSSMDVLPTWVRV